MAYFFLRLRFSGFFYLRSFTELYADLLASAVQCTAGDTVFSGRLLYRHPALDSVQGQVQVLLANQSINQSVNQSINQLIHQSINQLIHFKNPWRTVGYGFSDNTTLENVGILIVKTDDNQYPGLDSLYEGKAAINVH